MLKPGITYDHLMLRIRLLMNWLSIWLPIWITWNYRTTIIHIIGDSVHPHSHFPMAPWFFSRDSVSPRIVIQREGFLHRKSLRFWMTGWKTSGKHMENKHFFPSIFLEICPLGLGPRPGGQKDQRMWVACRCPTRPSRFEELQWMIWFDVYRVYRQDILAADHEEYLWALSCGRVPTHCWESSQPWSCWEENALSGAAVNESI